MQDSRHAAPRRASHSWFLGLLIACVPALASAGLGLQRVIPLPGVRGEIGGMALDKARQRLFVAVTGSDALLVVDLGSSALSGKLWDLDRPRSVAYLPARRRIAISNYGDGELELYDADKLTPEGSVTFGGDADGLVSDDSSARIYFGYGKGHTSGIGIVNDDGRPLMQLPLDSHPAGLALDTNSDRLYVNLPASRKIAVFDGASGRRLATWNLNSGSGSNYAMALDAAGDRLFVATRAPDRVLVLDTRSGRVLQSLVTPGDVASLTYNPAGRELYAASGGGKVVAYLDSHDGQLMENGEIRTARGARTALFDQDGGRYFLAVPATRLGVAEIRVYLATPAIAIGKP